MSYFFFLGGWVTSVYLGIFGTIHRSKQFQINSSFKAANCLVFLRKCQSRWCWSSFRDEDENDDWAHCSPSPQYTRWQKNTIYQNRLFGQKLWFQEGFPGAKHNQNIVIAHVYLWLIFVSLLILYDMDPWNSEFFATLNHLKMTPGPLNYI